MHYALKPSLGTVIATTVMLAGNLAYAQGAGDAEVIEVADDDSVPARDTMIEEVIVTAPPPDRYRVQTLELINAIYRAREKGAWLYRQQRYSEALPHLLAAAKRGFKYAQARVGFIYQQGLDDIPQNPEAAVGWLGVAAHGITHPEIRNHFNRTWSRIPEPYHAAFEEVIDNYVALYGNQANRVGCDMSHKAGSYIRGLTCRFTDEYLYQGFTVQDTLDGVESLTGSITPPGDSGIGTPTQ